MNARPHLSLLATSFALVFAAGFGPGSCGGEGPTDPLRPPPPPPLPPFACENLGEPACVADARCTPSYTPEVCECSGSAGRPAPCPEGSSCDTALPYPDPIDPTCACTPAAFAGCVDRGPCDGLDEQACQARPGCTAVYDGGGACTCGGGSDFRAPCDDDGNDCGGVPAPPPEPCDCLPVESTFAYCAEADPCTGLSEQACIADPRCSPEYGFIGCDDGGSGLRAPCHESDPNCGAPEPCDPAPGAYVGCGFGGGGSCPPVCDIYCPYGNVIDPNGCETCRCNPGPVDHCYGLDEATCLAAAECEARYESEVCCDGPGCPPCDPAQGVFAGCYPGQPHPGECWDDRDCPNGYCEHFATCAGLGCPPPPPSQCIYPSCDDGSAPTCFVAPPECGPGQVLAVRNGCFDCVDARTCGEVPPPPPPYCGDSSPVLCDALPPNCPLGTVVGVQNGCWACFEPWHCQAVACHDGTDVACRALPSECAPGEVLAIENGCWACVNSCN